MLREHYQPQRPWRVTVRSPKLSVMRVDSRVQPGGMMYRKTNSQSAIIATNLLSVKSPWKQNADSSMTIQLSANHQNSLSVSNGPKSKMRRNWRPSSGARALPHKLCHHVNIEYGGINGRCFQNISIVRIGRNVEDCDRKFVAPSVIYVRLKRARGAFTLII